MTDQESKGKMRQLEMVYVDDEYGLSVSKRLITRFEETGGGGRRALTLHAAAAANGVYLAAPIMYNPASHENSKGTSGNQQRGDGYGQHSHY